MAGRGTDIQLGGNYEENKVFNQKQLEKQSDNKNRVMEMEGFTFLVQKDMKAEE